MTAGTLLCRVFEACSTAQPGEPSPPPVPAWAPLNKLLENVAGYVYDHDA